MTGKNIKFPETSRPSTKVSRPSRNIIMSLLGGNSEKGWGGRKKTRPSLSHCANLSTCWNDPHNSNPSHNLLPKEQDQDPPKVEDEE